MMRFFDSATYWIYWRALRIAILCTFTLWLVNTLHIPYGRWSVFSIILVSQLNLGASIRHGWRRIQGTILGCLAGLLFGGILLQNDFNFVYTLPLWVFLTWYLSIVSNAWSTFFMIIGLTCFFYLVATPDISLDDLLLYRSVNIVIGVSIALFAEILWPHTLSFYNMQQHIEKSWQLISDFLIKFSQQLKLQSHEFSLLELELKEITKQLLEGKPLVMLVSYEPLRLVTEFSSLQEEMEAQMQLLEAFSSLLLLLPRHPKSSPDRIKDLAEYLQEIAMTINSRNAVTIDLNTLIKPEIHDSITMLLNMIKNSASLRLNKDIS